MRDFAGLMEKFNVSELESGLKIVTENIPDAGSFAIGFWFNTGTRNESEFPNGISHFVEHMIFKGTSKRNAKKITHEIESLGGYLNAFTTKEYTCFFAHGINGNFERTFEVLSDIVQHPLFLPEDIEKEKGVVFDEISDTQDSPEDLIYDEFETLIFKGNPLAFPILGTVDSLRLVKQKELFRFVEKYYGLNNLIVSVVGKIPHQKVLDAVLNNFGGFRKINSFKRELFLNSRPQRLHIQKDIKQSHLILGKPVDGYKSKKRILARLLSVILGEGSSSRLFQTLREENGIAYQINAFINSYFETSAFGIYLSTNEKKFPAALELIHKEIDSLKKNVLNEEELKRAKEYLKGSYILSSESLTNRMQRLAHSLTYYGKVKTVDEIVNEIDSVSSHDILEFSRSVLTPEEFSTVVISANNKLILSAA